MWEMADAAFKTFTARSSKCTAAARVVAAEAEAEFDLSWRSSPIPSDGDDANYEIHSTSMETSDSALTHPSGKKADL